MSRREELKALLQSEAALTEGHADLQARIDRLTVELSPLVARRDELQARLDECAAARIELAKLVD